MGVLYYVACRDCKKTRDLDKFCPLCEKAADRPQALALAEMLQQPGWAFRAALLTSFLWEHRGHNCTVFSEREYELCQEMEPDADECAPGSYAEDGEHFWRTSDGSG